MKITNEIVDRVYGQHSAAQLARVRRELESRKPPKVGRLSKLQREELAYMARNPSGTIRDKRTGKALASRGLAAPEVTYFAGMPFREYGVTLDGLVHYWHSLILEPEKREALPMVARVFIALELSKRA